MGHLVQDLSWHARTNRHCSDCNELVEVMPTVNVVDQGSCRASTLVLAYGMSPRSEGRRYDRDV